MFLGGARSIITITNPNVVRERRLVIFRDSFGSSIQGALRATKEFDKVQTELARRKRISRQYSGKSIFSSRIVCGDCGSYFGSKVWNSTSKYRRVIWQCNSKFQGGKTLASY